MDRSEEPEEGPALDGPLDEPVFHVHVMPGGYPPASCYACDEPFRNRDAASFVVVGVEEGEPVTELICWSCAIRPPHEELPGQLKMFEIRD